MSMSLSKLLLVGLSSLLLLPCPAQLPMLTEKPWLGYFAGHERRGFTFGISASGRIELQAKRDNGGVMGVGRVIYIDPEVIEVVEGRDVFKKVIPESLTTTDKPTATPQKVSFRAKVTGNAEYEVTCEIDGDDVYVQGRLLDAGELKNPLRFEIRVRYGDVYRYTPAEKLEDETERDRIDTLGLDRKKGKIKVFEKVDLGSEAINGKGLSSVEVELKGLNYRKFSHEAQGASSLRLENAKGIADAPLQGFCVIWRVDKEKDPEHKARLYIRVK
jgi:hypothetical protein